MDETDKKAQEKITEAGFGYRGFLPLKNGRPIEDGEELKITLETNAKRFEAQGEPGAAENARHLLDGPWQFEHDLMLIGSPDTVAKKLRQYANEGLFNTYFAEFNFGNLSEHDLMRSIRLFGTEVIPKLREFEPF